jgi:tetratricopeptide (TPR) repeat protein
MTKEDLLPEAEVSSTPVLPSASDLEEFDQKTLEIRQIAIIDPYRALELARTIREEAHSMSYKLGIGNSWWLAGNAHVQLAQHTQALQAFQTSLDFFEQEADLMHQSWALNGIATVYTQLAIYDTALEYYLKALNLSRISSDNIGMGIQLSNIGELHLSLEHYEEALEYLQKALEVLNQILLEAGTEVVRIRLKSTIAATLGGIGEVYVRQGQCDMGLEYLEQAEQTASATNALYHLSQINCRLGRAYRHLHQHDKALHYLEKALQIADVSNKPLMPETLLLLGHVYLGKQDFVTAATHYNRALELAAKITARQWVYEAHLALSKVYESIGDLGQALYHHQLFAQVKEEVGGAKTQQALAVTQTRFEVEHAAQEREIYRLRNVELAAANAQIAELNTQLKSENLRMSTELEITQRLQQMVLPRSEELELVAGLEIAPFMLAAD